MKTEANDPIYPTTYGYDKYNYPEGLTKREYFAAMAIQGLLADVKDIIYPITQVAKDAVNYADALIDELNKDD